MCYAGPVIGAIVSTFAWKRSASIKIWWLTLLFWGGALFGVIDHLYNGELFMISENFGRDLLLGFIITVSILTVWAILIAFGRKNAALAKYAEAKS